MPDGMYSLICSLIYSFSKYLLDAALCQALLWFREYYSAEYTKSCVLGICILKAYYSVIL